MTDELSETRWAGMIVVGQVARPHGRCGEVVVNIESDFPDRRFCKDAVVYINGASGVEALRILEARFHSGRPIVAIEGFESISDAEMLIGKQLRVPLSDQFTLPEGTYYEYSLVGCEVSTVDGRQIGVVVGVQGVSGSSRLVVEGVEAGDEIQIPLAQPICVSIEPEQKSVVIDPPPGLLDLNRVG